MGIFSRAILGVSNDEVKEYVALRKGDDADTLSGQQRRRLDKLENGSDRVRIPRGVIREIERKHL